MAPIKEQIFLMADGLVNGTVTSREIVSTQKIHANSGTELPWSRTDLLVLLATPVGSSRVQAYTSHGSSTDKHFRNSRR